MTINLLASLIIKFIRALVRVRASRVLTVWVSERKLYIYIYKCIYTLTHAHIHAYVQTDRQTDRQTCLHM